jgi:anaerobic C4-dicarboxylate transporter
VVLCACEVYRRRLQQPKLKQQQQQQQQQQQKGTAAHRWEQSRVW